MRTPRDFDADLAALDEKARTLRHRKIMQLGDLVIACRADTLPIDVLAGALLAAVASRDTAAAEEWRVAGAAMFRPKTSPGTKRARSNRTASAAHSGDASPGDSGIVPA